MEIKKDLYRKGQVMTMLSYMTGSPDTDYPAKLSHWSREAKTINIEEDVLNVLASAYAGEYIEVNCPKAVPTTGVTLEFDGVAFEGCLFWCMYEYEDRQYPLFFVRLPRLTNWDIVRLLGNFDVLYGNTNQETTDWMLEYQLLTRMLVHDHSLLVNPLYLDISDEEVFRELTKGLFGPTLEVYKRAREISQEAIRKAFAGSEQ